MKELPILFNGAMVRAILAGQKTQTRRIMKPQPEATPDDYQGPAGHWWPSNVAQSMVHVEHELQNKSGGWGGLAANLCPFGQLGDRLWVRETWQFYDWTEDGEPCIRFAADEATTWPEAPQGEALVDQWEILSRPENYNIDNAARDRRWRPSIHMPRWASRITLEITGVRVERLQAISEADARAEGVTIEDKHMGGYCAGEFLPPAIRAFRELWNCTGGDWNVNPWCWVIEFKRVTP